ncbi:hypothetical protein IQ13_4205 [Lacibacter cauensis]|uniref:YD repeat-containing protein n=1 Tax=Lacibacter cauensis TaxID=510947 RepID=A0A562S9Z7_9BACT|nr:hypothetical protein [Lacibacter cauensis]TWI77963.1 hypothetical protein IQ13_4205 [Lacibacter cauensis]
MYLDETREILKTFNSVILKLNGVFKISEFCIPETRKGMFFVRYLAREFLIDREGRICDYKTLRDQKIRKWEQYEYRENGDLNLIKEYFKDRVRRVDEWKCGNNTIVIDKIISEKDKDGNIVESTFYGNGGLKTRKVKNENGLLIEEKEYKSQKVVADSVFDEEGRVATIQKFDTKGNQTTKRTFEYDERGNMIRYTYRGKNGIVTTDRKLSYDIYNNLIDDVDIAKDIYNLLPAVDLDRLANEKSKESYRHKYYYDCNQLLFEHQIYLAGQFGVAYEYEYEFLDSFYHEKYLKC